MLYRHYKGGIYKHLLEAQHTETGEKLTIYISLETGKVWARPTEMFEEFVKADEVTNVPRFLQIDNIEKS